MNGTMNIIYFGEQWQGKEHNRLRLSVTKLFCSLSHWSESNRNDLILKCVKTFYLLTLTYFCPPDSLRCDAATLRWMFTKRQPTLVLHFVQVPCLSTCIQYLPWSCQIYTCVWGSNMYIISWWTYNSAMMFS